ncbi:hypothetical protein MKW94_002409 [Papaver nudicaule]|uniref:Acyl-[acyl-carrier-protein] hydrolase n=1 Tax=Papaver nudicaule TaxID=74823 RepID=A0AA42B3M9_PAPNU|nr:hypothetical protein [Papaver nudicaule]
MLLIRVLLIPPFLIVHSWKVRSEFSDSQKINHAIVSHTTLPEKIKKKKKISPPTQKSEFISHLLDGNEALTKKQWATLAGIVFLGRLVHDGLAFRQNFSIRSYEICGNRNASMETLMNHLQRINWADVQDASLNHVRSLGLLNDGLGMTPEMTKRNLIWVVAKVEVQVDRYPSWGDVAQVDTWINCLLVLMNKSTRKLSKLPDEVRGELEPYFMECEPILNNGSRKLTKLSSRTYDFVQTGLTPRWNDLDANQHVNNVKYIRWILEYRKECEMGNMLQSLTAVGAQQITGSSKTMVECDHTLLLEDGSEVLRGRTIWRPNSSN